MSIVNTVFAGAVKPAVIIFGLLIASSCCGQRAMTEEETALINQECSVLRVLTVDNKADLKVLRARSSDFSDEDLKTPEYKALERKLVSTLEACDGGVGLAAPQVGINRRVVAVMRLDKEGEPIEVYPNLRIVEKRGEKVSGREGCLSVPDKYGEVLRYRDITIAYTVPGDDEVREVRERITGFTAVIFQHEADHLDGILYTDKLD